MPPKKVKQSQHHQHKHHHHHRRASATTQPETASMKSDSEGENNPEKVRAELAGAFSGLRVGTNLPIKLLTQQDELELDDQFDKSSKLHKQALAQWRKRSLYALLTTVMGLIIATIFLWLGLSGATRQENQEFDQRANELIQALMETLHDYETSALWIQESCRASKDQVDTSLPRGICTWDDFLEVHEYIVSTGLQFNSIRFIPNVTHDERPALEEASRIYLKANYPMINYVGFSEPTGAAFTAQEVNETTTTDDEELVVASLPDEDDTTTTTFSIIDANNNSTDGYNNSTTGTSLTQQEQEAATTTTTNNKQEETLLLNPINSTVPPTANDGETVINFSFYQPRRPAAWYLPVHRFAPMPAPIIDVDFATGELLLYIQAALQTNVAKLWPRKKFLPILREDGFLLVHPGIRLHSHSHQPNRGVAIVLFYTSQVLAGALRYREPDGKTVYLYDVSDNELEPLYYGGAYACGENDIDDEDLSNTVGRYQVCAVPNEVSFAQLQSQHNGHNNDDGWNNNNRRPKMIFRDIVVLDKTLRMVVTAPADNNLSGQETLIILGGVLILVACVVLAVSFYLHMGRVSKLNEKQAAAATERANLIIGNAKRAMIAERELNDYIAHEVRNPISAAITANSFVTAELDQEDFCSALDQDRLQTLREDAHTVGSSLTYVTDLLRNMLDLHKATSNGIVIEKIPTDVLHDIFQPVATLIGNRKGDPCEIQMDCPDQLVINADRMRLKQVILNLAGNSRKFVRKGFVRLVAKVSGPDGNDVELAVEDSGQGIPEHKRDILFDKFQESLDRLNQGTGVGLCLCKNLVELMDGTIRLDETYDSGTPGCPGARFVVYLRNVKLSDTDSTVLNSQDGFLTPSSPMLQVATPPSAALFGIDENKAIYEDHHGGLDGSSNHNIITPSSPLEESAPLVSSAPLFAVQAAATPPSPLAAAAAAALPNTPASNDGSAQQKGVDNPLPENLRVLFVDDDMMLRKLFTRAVKKVAPGWDVMEASNGETSVVMVDTHEYDLIFMDQYMASVEKQMLGTETVRALRAKGVKSVICGLSANDSKDIFVEAGADTFMLKPFPCKKDELAAKLQEIISYRKKPLSELC